MIIIDDNDVCSICGSYFQGNGYCTNGHLKLIENMGDKFRLIKDHHDFPKGSVCVVMGISHFPTMYHLKDLETSKTLTVPVHSVERMP